MTLFRRPQLPQRALAPFFDLIQLALHDADVFELAFEVGAFVGEDLEQAFELADAAVVAGVVEVEHFANLDQREPRGLPRRASLRRTRSLPKRSEGTACMPCILWQYTKYDRFGADYRLRLGRGQCPQKCGQARRTPIRSGTGVFQSATADGRRYQTQPRRTSISCPRHHGRPSSATHHVHLACSRYADSSYLGPSHAP